MPLRNTKPKKVRAMTDNERSHGVFFKRFHVHKNLFSPEQCSKIIGYFENNKSDRAAVVNLEESKDSVVPMNDTQVRDGKICFIHHNNRDLNFVFQNLYYSVLWANFGWSLLPLRYLQIAKYDANDVGGFYKSHRDIIQVSKPQRIISSVTQLSAKDDYTGCELVFDAESNGAPLLEEYSNIGDTVFFTSVETHEVKPILSGVRYSLTAWFEGPTIWNSESEYYV